MSHKPKLNFEKRLIPRASKLVPGQNSLWPFLCCRDVFPAELPHRKTQKTAILGPSWLRERQQEVPLTVCAQVTYEKMASRLGQTSGGD